jgi:hypothetical protein
LVGNPDKHLKDREVDKRKKSNIQMVLQEIDWLDMSQSIGPCQNFLERGKGIRKLAFKLTCKPFKLVLNLLKVVGFHTETSIAPL